MTAAIQHDERLLETFLGPIRKCGSYKPAFGQGRTDTGLSLEEFSVLYGGDPFYSWIGLNDPVVYAAHRAAGGITSIYRQLGVGSERLIRSVFASAFEVDSHQLNWSYSYKKPNGADAVHTLDAKVSLDDLAGEAQDRLSAWLRQASSQLSQLRGDIEYQTILKGVVFEVRQGYKSADSKRQNADLRFGMRAYQEDLLPVLLVLSSQVSAPVVSRYRTDGMLVLTGVVQGGPLVSTFDFFESVVNFDLRDFFARHSDAIKKEITGLVGTLLSPQ